MRPQKFRRGIVGESAKAIGIHALGFINEILDELGHLPRATPADDVGRDFIRNAEREHRWMAGAGINRAAHRIASGRTVLRRVQKAQMLVPANIDEQLEIVLGGKFEQPLGWHIINPDQIAAQFMNLGKVPGGLLRRTEWLAGGVGRERSVRDTFGVVFFSAKPEEFAIHANAWAGGGRLCHGI